MVVYENGFSFMYKHVRTDGILRKITCREKRHIAQQDRCMGRSCSSFFKTNLLAREEMQL